MENYQFLFKHCEEMKAGFIFKCLFFYLAMNINKIAATL